MAPKLGPDLVKLLQEEQDVLMGQTYSPVINAEYMVALPSPFVVSAPPLMTSCRSDLQLGHNGL